MAKQPGGFGGSAESGLSTVDMCLPLLNCLTGAGPYPGVGSGCRGRGRGPFSTLSLPWGGLFHSNDLRIPSTVFAIFISSIRLFRCPENTY